MKKIVKFILICVSLSFLLIILPLTAWSATRSYLVTEGLTLNPAPVHGIGYTLWTQNTNVDFTKRGRVIVSSKPDGTGNLDIGEGIQIYNINSFQNILIKGSQDCVTFNSNIPPIDITNIMTTHIDSGANNNITISFGDLCGGVQHIGPIYIVNTDLPDPAPEPFLDLPWDYESKGLSFNEAALSMSSYFDHTYPLLGSGIIESSNYLNQISTFENEKSTRKSYSSHNGYDWAATAKAKFGDNVLAAAEGEATYVNTCADCGNMIFVDHANGYRTIYMHLQKEGLITNIPGQKVYVLARQPIGRVGATGHVIPEGKEGAHIHFGVVQDKNKDGSFDGEQPWGLTDPFGWQASGTDPWEIYSTTFNNEQKTGNKSYYLWKNKTDALKQKFDQNGGTFKAGKNTIVMPKFAMNQQVTLELKSAPQVNISPTQESIGSVLIANIIHATGSFIHFLLSPYTLSVDFNGSDINRYKDGSLAIYSSEDGVNWQRENTTVDLVNKKATITISHMSYFALVGERKDIVPPITTAQLSGTQIVEGQYSSDVNITLESNDGTDSSGVNYTLYQLDNGDWEIYKDSLVISEEGKHVIHFYSEDKDGNVEEQKSVEFEISKVPLELEMYFDINKKDMTIIPKDSLQNVQVTETTSKKHIVTRTFKSGASERLTLVTQEKDREHNTKFKILSLQYNDEPPVEFDKEKSKFSFQIDEDTIKRFRQTYKRQNMSLTLTYIGRSDTTTVKLKEGKKETETELDGIRLLKITTERGNLKYSY